jgi:hypothetical protein
MIHHQVRKINWFQAQFLENFLSFFGTFGQRLRIKERLESANSDLSIGVVNTFRWTLELAISDRAPI